MPRRPRNLYRSKTDSMLAGVAGGMAEYFDIDPILIRIVWIVLGLASAGSALIAYVVMAIVVPEGSSTSARPNIAMSESSEVLIDDAPNGGGASPWTRGHFLFGIALVAVGGALLLSLLLPWWRWDIVLPLALIVIGIALIMSRFIGGNDD